MMMVMMMGVPARRKTAELARGVGGVNVQLRVEIVDGKSAQESCCNLLFAEAFARFN